jgi:nucleoside-diphosphate-sugar epimerase
MSKILVTGAAGFLGTYLVPLLRRSHEVVATDRQDLDVRDITAVHRVIQRHRPDLVCHLAALCGAAPSRENPPDYYAVNTLGTVHLLEACRQAGVERFLFTSSLTVHGESPDPVHESSAFSPRHPYAASKVAAEFAVRDYSLHCGIRSIIVRPTLVVGEGSKELHALGDFVLKALREEEIVLFGAGDHRRDFVHPHDVAAALLLAVERLDRAVDSNYEIFNISQGQALRMRELADLAIRLVGSGRHRVGPINNQSFSLYTQIDRARQVLQFAPRIGIDDMILRMVRNFKETNTDELPSHDTGHHHHQRAAAARGLCQEP